MNFWVAENHSFVQLRYAQGSSDIETPSFLPSACVPRPAGRVAAGGRRLAPKLSPTAPTRPACHTGGEISALTCTLAATKKKATSLSLSAPLQVRTPQRPAAGDGALDLQLFGHLRPCVPFVRGTPLHSCACAIPHSHQAPLPEYHRVHIRSGPGDR